MKSLLRCLGTVIIGLLASVSTVSQTRLTSSATTLEVTSQKQDGRLVLTATPSSSIGNVNAGQVSFVVDGTNVSTVQVAGLLAAGGTTAGSAVTAIRLPTGTHQVVAIFLGFGSFASSQSPPVRVSVTSADTPQPVLSIAQTPKGPIDFTYVT